MLISNILFNYRLAFPVYPLNLAVQKWWRYSCFSLWDWFSSINCGMMQVKKGKKLWGCKPPLVITHKGSWCNFWQGTEVFSSDSILNFSRKCTKHKSIFWIPSKIRFNRKRAKIATFQPDVFSQWGAPTYTPPPYMHFIQCLIGDATPLCFIV